MSEQGYSVARFPPFWEVVERKNAQGRTEHVVVDTSPRLKEQLPVRVFGPDTKNACIAWAKLTSALYLTAKGTFVTD